MIYLKINKKSIKFFSICFAALMLSLVMIGCRAKKNQSKNWQPPSDEYAFIEYYQINDGKEIEGIAPPGMRIDGPTYSYSSNDGEVSSYLTPSFNKDTIIAVLARGLVLRGTAGGGLHSRLIPINKLPFTEALITIASISSNDVQFELEGESVILPVGQEWEKITQSIDTLSLPDGNVIIQKSTTQRVVFHGFLKKEKLIFR
jgi:hypothetical protein